MSRIATLCATFLLASVAVLHAQNSVRTLNSQVLELHGIAQNTGSTEVQLSSKVAALLRQRFEALKALIAEKQREALLVAFSTDLLAEMRTDFRSKAQTWRRMAPGKVKLSTLFRMG